MADDADMATDLVEAERADLIAGRRRAVDCAICGEPIPVARRRAMPSATLCVDCQERRERKGLCRIG